MRLSNLILKLSLVFVFITFSNNSFAQNTDILKDELYIKYEDAYKKYISSDNYREYQIITKDIASKTKAKRWLDIKSLDNLDSWLDENFSKTTFASKSEAKAAILKAFKLAEYDLEAKKESNTLFSELNKKYDSKLIMSTVANRIQLGTIF
ncbi:hypothetical protein MG290_11535 [Flavobacterium sp. CBA20B-1]|uniref:hypothetical protein n=1 Tax=unclassified Flavobacterium TaxID=196869 RepID=UPI0022254564|nr:MULTISPECIES: hypothetical protein [unclassified Flavobacterium]WCM41574.1 hypothetical protein MG290_11535 [Flavobacterium sp. CBA20B-1]